MFPPILTEWFITYITAIWKLLSSYTLMYLQTICVPECFMTHITWIWMFHSMYPLSKTQKGEILLF